MKRSPSGFTLVELLVVIGIIAALASLLLVAGSAAMRASREAAIKVEAGQIADAFTAYTNDVSAGSYPPNLTYLPQNNTTNAEAFNSFKRHFNKAFPQHRESPKLIELLATGIADGDYRLGQASGTPEAIGLTPFEAIPFWLGGFSSDPKYPISGPGGPSFNKLQGEDLASRKGIGLFDVTRMGPRDSGGNAYGGRYIEYPDPADSSITRQINLWVYFPRNLTQPYAYFDASSKPKYKVAYGSQELSPLAILKANATGGTTIGNLRLANDGKCQILSCGLDDAWGNFAAEGLPVDWTQAGTTSYGGILYPDGPWTGELADTITNFSTGRTLEDSQP
ncbi:type II secretion system protein [Aeoliella sp. SH292]|uniref:type II secretion system protein n=1 Tax=Aeoliella sp. SH292 TaxID=3454464 RepID=UPI003F9AB6D0